MPSAQSPFASHLQQVLAYLKAGHPVIPPQPMQVPTPTLPTAPTQAPYLPKTGP